ncbi:hypothetical protein BHE74_00003522 [Ensete ventricosum]|nr:hypothetical protein GW17_00023287 [Ensete ventricosum]RWW87636.1 hypothetical protein BHE74_00003522 [Ensete ventricosum]
MAGIPRASFGLVVVMVLGLAILMPAVQAQAPAPAPTSDGDLMFPFFFLVFFVRWLSSHWWVGEKDATHIERPLAPEVAERCRSASTSVPTMMQRRVIGP